MAYDTKRNKMKPNKTASPAARKKTAGPNGSFPVGTKKNARLAIPGATQSFNAGHIGKGTENKIKSEARAELGKGKSKAAAKSSTKPKPKPKMAAKPKPKKDHLKTAARHTAIADKHRAMADLSMANASIDALNNGATPTPSEYGGPPRVKFGKSK